MTVDYFAKAFLIFSNGWFLFPFMMIGLIWLDHKIFYQLFCLILLSILSNIALKNTFQIPLAASLGIVGYAFPSGHMQFSTVTYTWLGLHIKNSWLRIAIFVLLIGIAWGLIHFNYHNIEDVMAGFFVGIFLITLYTFVASKWPNKLPGLILSLATCLTIYIFFRSNKISDPVWMAYYGLWGLTLAEQVIKRNVLSNLSLNKFLGTFLFLLMFSLIYIFFHYVVRPQYPSYISQLQWLFIGFMIPCVNNSKSKVSTMTSPRSSRDWD